MAATPRAERDPDEPFVARLCRLAPLGNRLGQNAYRPGSMAPGSDSSALLLAAATNPADRFGSSCTVSLEPSSEEAPAEEMLAAPERAREACVFGRSSCMTGRAASGF